MREILFRGQTRKKGEKVRMDGTPVESNWVYGGIFQGQNRSVIYGYDPVEKHVVYSETIGQYTGLKDKNGNRIFEGDIVKRCFTLTRGEHKKTRETQIGVVRYKNSDCAFWLENTCSLRRPWPGDTLEVIGNIHDNPELV